MKDIASQKWLALKSYTGFIIQSESTWSLNYNFTSLHNFSNLPVHEYPKVGPPYDHTKLSNDTEVQVFKITLNPQKNNKENL